MKKTKIKQRKTITGVKKVMYQVADFFLTLFVTSIIIFIVLGVLYVVFDKMADVIVTPKQETEVRKIAQPLVIDTEEQEQKTIQGVYEGTVTIKGEGTQGNSYEGVLMIQKDGKYVRVVADDVIRSEFGDEF